MSNDLYWLTKAEKKVLQFLRHERALSRIHKDKKPCGWDNNMLYAPVRATGVVRQHGCLLNTIRGLVRAGYLSVNPLSGGLVEIWEIPTNWAQSNRKDRREVVKKFFNDTGASV